MYTRNLLWLVSPVSAAPLYAADVPANTPLAPQQVFRYNNHSDRARSTRKRWRRILPRRLCWICLKVWYGWTVKAVQPAQAECWEILDGGKRYIFHLRSGLQWSDGQPLTAEDFVLGWQRAVDPKRQALLLAIWHRRTLTMPRLLLRVKQMLHRWVSKRWMIVLLKLRLSSQFLGSRRCSRPTLFPVPHHVIAKHGDSWSKPENMVYNGAFVLDQWVVNEKITARKNPKYRDAQHTVLQQVEYLALDNSVTGYNRYRAGEVDLTGSGAANSRH